MNHSMPGLPAHHQLLEFTQTHVHQVSDAIHSSVLFNYFHRVCNYHHYLLPEYFHDPQKKSLYLPVLILTIVWQILLYFLSLWIWLFWTIYIDGIIHYVAFCDWLLSLYILLSQQTVLWQMPFSRLEKSFFLYNWANSRPTFCLTYTTLL